MSPDAIFFLATVAIGAAVLLALALLPAFPSWWHARSSGYPVPITNVLMMRMRKIKPFVVVQSYVKAQEAALPVQLRDLEYHALAGGCVTRCVDAMIEAHARGLEVDWLTIICLDLAGRDPLDALSGADGRGR